MQIQQGELKADFLEEQKNKHLTPSDPIQISDQNKKEIEEQIEIQQQPQIKYSYQQQIVVPSPMPLIGQVYPNLYWSIEQLENAFRSYTNFFCGCNMCFSCIAIIVEVVRLGLVLSFEQIAATVVFLIQDFSFVLHLIFFFLSYDSQKEKLLFWNQIFLLSAIICQIIGSIIMIVEYKQKTHQEDEQLEDIFSMQYFILNLIIFVFCYVWFIRYIRQIREIMGAIIQVKKNCAIIQPEKQALLNQNQN